MDKNNIQDIYTLSTMQSGMLFHWMMNNDSRAYFEQTDIIINGELDLDAAKESFEDIIQRYDIFRTIFIYERVSVPQQVVLKKTEIDYQYKDFRNTSEDSIEDYLIKDNQKGFNLSEKPSIRLAILRTKDDEYHMVWSYHHILMDGWCLGIVFNEFIQIYHAKKNNDNFILAPTTPYSKFIKWLESQDKEEAIKYWNNYIGDYETKVVLPSMNADPSVIKGEKKSRKFEVSSELSKKIDILAQENQVSVNTVMQTVYAIVLQKYNRINDVTFGYVTSGRPSDIEGIEKMVGLFINTIPLRVKNEHDDTFRNVLRKIQQQTTESTKWEYMSLAEVQNLSPMKKDLVNTLYVFENYPVEKNLLDNNSESIGFKISQVNSKEETNFDFGIVVFKTDKLIYQLNYGDKYTDDGIARIGSHIENVLRQITEQSDIKIDDIELIDEKEKELLKLFNNTKEDFPRELTIQQMFEEQVLLNPDKMAVEYDDNKLTYKELNEKANAIAWSLREKGVGRDVCVGIFVERSLEMIAGILGIIKAGGAYVPIDTTYPDDRIKYMLDDSNVPVILTQKRLKERLIQITDRTLFFLDNNEIYKGRTDNPDIINKPNDLVYIIYTSGSTGLPKGVMAEYHSLTNLILTQIKHYDFSHDENVLLFSNISFDASIELIFLPLSYGAKLYVVDKETINNIDDFRYYLIDKRISHIDITPSYIATLNLKDLYKINRVVLGGEASTWKLIQEINSNNIFNAYAPSETTCTSLVYKAGEGNKDCPFVPIGKPIANTTIYIVDELMRIQPIGVPGEICIGGEGVSRGYMNRDDLTSERFIKNPFESEGRIYKSGDLGRWLEDGNIEYLGRIDGQIKIRGFRIEIGEIESHLHKYPGIKECVVIVRENESGDKTLCAYFVSEDEINISELRNYLESKVPEYMVPSYFMKIDRIPITVNGKVDKRNLPKPVVAETENTDADYELTENEKQLLSIWKNVLGLDNISINDNFFKIGGDSIKAIKLLSQIKKIFDTTIKIKDIFVFNTIHTLAKEIEGSESISIQQNEQQNEAKKCLSVVYPPITSYMHHAPLLSIIADTKDYLPWFIMNYMQICVHTSGMVDFYNFHNWDLNIPLLDVSHLDRDLVLDNLNDGFFNFVKKLIDREKYLIISIDQFYIPLYDVYQIEHSQHGIFVYGYNIDNSSLYVADFFSSGVYSFEEVSVSQVEQAFMNVADPKYHMQGFYTFQKAFYEPRFFIKDFAQLIPRFLNGNEPSILYNKAANWGFRFGIDVFFERIETEFKKMCSREIFDFRVFAIYADHLKIIYMAIEYLIEIGVTGLLKLRQRSHILYSDIRRINKELMNCFLTKSEITIKESDFHKFYDSEKELLSNLLEVVNNTNQSDLLI